MTPTTRLLLGCVLISFSSVFANLANVPPTISAFYRVAIGGTALAMLALFGGFGIARRPRPIGLMLAAAIFFALDLGFWHRSIVAIGPGLSTLLASLQVFFMTAATVVLFKQRPSWQQWVAIPIAMTGLAMIVGLDWSMLSSTRKVGIVFGLLTAFTYAGYMLTLRQTQKGHEQTRHLPVAELAVIALASAVLLAGSAVVEDLSFAIPSAIDVLWLACLGLVCHVGGWLLIAHSLPRMSPAVAGLTLTVQPVLTVVWDVLIFGRELSTLEIAGGLVTVSGIYLGSKRA